MIHHPASLVARAFAAVIDMSIISIVAFIISLITGFPILQKASGDWRIQLVFVLYFAILPILWNGRTIGKYTTHIMIVKRNGKRIDYVTMLLRELVGFWLLGVITFGITILISICLIAFSKEKRGIHDYVAGTYVTMRN
ncbi:RDD family protein [Ectobacillus polymachus]|uniref:RDD family protein n=1 Tax=Ectobacillus polymachus TaxID=1508806 RepID=UPI003A8860BE